MTALRSLAAILLLVSLCACESSRDESELIVDPQTLESMSDEELEELVVNHAYANLEGRHGDVTKILETLQPGTRAVYLTSILEGEVNNGGFHQYYWNTGGRFAPGTVDAFHYFGLDQHAALMQEANAVYREEAAVMAGFQRLNTMQGLLDFHKITKLNQFDRRFFQLDEISPVRAAIIRAMPEDFLRR
jgi:hypothetical protein